MPYHPAFAEHLRVCSEAAARARREALGAVRLLNAIGLLDLLDLAATADCCEDWYYMGNDRVTKTGRFHVTLTVDARLKPQLRDRLLALPYRWQPKVYMVEGCGDRLTLIEQWQTHWGHLHHQPCNNALTIRWVKPTRLGEPIRRTWGERPDGTRGWITTCEVLTETHTNTYQSTAVACLRR